MKYIATVLCIVVVASASVASRIEVQPLPEPVRPLAEVGANFALSASKCGDNLWNLLIELEASAT